MAEGLRASRASRQYCQAQPGIDRAVVCFGPGLGVCIAGISARWLPPRLVLLVLLASRFRGQGAGISPRDLLQ